MGFSSSVQSNYPSKFYSAPDPKSYSSAGDTSHGASKALGNDPSLAQWVEDAKAYIGAVQRGEIQIRTPEEQQYYQACTNEYLPWALAQLGMQQNAWDPMTGGSYSEGGSSQSPQVNPYGGELGQSGSWNYDIMKTNVGFTGDNSRNDIYGSDNTLNFDQPSAKVSFEMSQDQGVEVLKVIVTTSKGTAVYYYDAHDSADFQLNVNMADPTRASGLDALPANLQEKIKVEQFDAEKAVEESAQEASVEGKVVNESDNFEELEYEAESMGDVIAFSFEPGKTQTHVVWGDADVTLKPADRAAIIDNPDGTITLVIRHRDNSYDTLKLQEGFKLTIHGGKDQLEVPDDLAERVTFDALDAEEVPVDDEAAEAERVASEFASLDYMNLSSEEIQEKAEGLIDLANPPRVPNENVFRFFVAIDPELKSLLEAFNGADNKTKLFLSGQIKSRVIDLLNALYGSRVSVTTREDKTKAHDNIYFGETPIDLIPGGRFKEDDRVEDLWDILSFQIIESD